MTGGLASPPASRNNSPIFPAGSSLASNVPNLPSPAFGQLTEQEMGHLGVDSNEEEDIRMMDANRAIEVGLEKVSLGSSKDVFEDHPMVGVAEKLSSEEGGVIDVVMVDVKLSGLPMVNVDPENSSSGEGGRDGENGVMKHNLSGSSKDLVHEIPNFDAEPNYASSEDADIGVIEQESKKPPGSSKDFDHDVRMDDDEPKKLPSEDEEDDVPIQDHMSLSHSSGEEEVDALGLKLPVSTSEDVEDDDAIRDHKSLSDSSGEEEVDASEDGEDVNSESVVSSLPGGEGEDDGDIMDESEDSAYEGVGGVDANSPDDPAAPFEPRRSLRNVEKKPQPIVEAPAPPAPRKSSNVKRKPAFKKNPILLQVSFENIIFSKPTC
jgi:hypothetical protein